MEAVIRPAGRAAPELWIMYVYGDNGVIASDAFIGMSAEEARDRALLELIRMAYKARISGTSPDTTSKKDPLDPPRPDLSRLD